LDEEGSELVAVQPEGPRFVVNLGPTDVEGGVAINELFLLAVLVEARVDSRRATVERILPVSFIHRPNSSMWDRRTLKRLRLASWHQTANRRRSVA